MSSRRTFLKQCSTVAGGLLVMPSHALSAMQHPTPVKANTLNASTLTPFVDALTFPSVAKARGTRPIPGSPKEKAPYYRFAARPTEMKVHRDLPATRFWSYAATMPGPTLELRSGEPVLVEWANELPQQHFLPIDHHLHGAGPSVPQVRIVSHLHGGRVHAGSDGYPEDWFAPGNSRVYYYPNQQDAATLWYHDHAMGINRLNVYAGLFGAAFVRDSFEDKLNLPKDTYEFPLLMCDRLLTPEGQLYYPTSTRPGAPWVADFSGDALLVNGKLFPYLEVEPRKYRLRIVNTSNSRILHLNLPNDLEFHQIGSDQGLLAAPVSVKTLILAPAERGDMIVDFSAARGEQVVLKNDTSAVMQFRVSPNKIADSSSLPAQLRPVVRTPESDATTTRVLTLDEYIDKGDESMLLLLNNSYWHDPITEKPAVNSTEIWSFLNPTDDIHPIHLHAVRFQILDRQRYDAWAYDTRKELKTLGARIPPSGNEAGWKDVVRVMPKMVTRIIVKFDGYPGKYVWHCHTLEHEDNEMMRPYEIVG